ncbi:MAG: hypothetical protein ACLQVI_18530 [Polyangiaceae bacterium]
MEKAPRPAQLEAAIRELTQDLLEMTVTPHVRELRAKAVTYGRVIGNWSVYAPSAPQLQAMQECVTELEEKVADAKRGEVSRVGRKPGDSEASKALPNMQRGASVSAPARPGKGIPPPLPSEIPPSLGWNPSTQESSGVRARRSSNPRPPKNEAPTRPPPPISGSPPTASGPPLSSPRPIEEHPTPVPALLRSRRSH